MFRSNTLSDIFLCALTIHAQETPDRWTPEVMIKFKRVGQTAVSPDGKLVAYTVSTPIMEGEKSEYLTHIHIVSSDGNMDYQFTRGEKSCSNPTFSPDGNYLAFTSGRGSDSKNQVWISRLNGGDPERLTDAESGINAYKWSPDSKRIAYTMNDPDTEEEKKNKKEKRDMKVLDTNYEYSHLYTTSIEKDIQGERKVKRLTSGKFHVTNFDWSPDGKTIAFSHQVNPSFDVWLSSDISSVQSDSGVVKPLVSWKGADFVSKYSPDGKWLAFGSDGGDPKWAFHIYSYIMPSQGGEHRKLAATPDSNPSEFIGWSSDSKKIYFTEASRTSRLIFELPVSGKITNVFTTGVGNYTNAALSKNGKVMAFVYQTPEVAPDVYVTSTKDFKPMKLTNVNADFPILPMGKTEVITWKSRDGMVIEGLLTYPVHYEKGQRYPLILSVHGGPMGVYTQTFTAASNVYPTQAFAQEGYAILRPNPRGSSGYGKDFRFANYNDWGFGDYDDLMAGVDKVIEMGIAHPDSLCVMGWSYGGYMTSFIVTKTNRFKAASVGAGLPNLISFTGTTDIHSFIPDYFGGEFWDRTEIYMKHSGIFHVKNVTTPTQILHGENDRRVPLSQGEEFYNALKRRDLVTEMVVYPRTPHGVREPKFIEDVGKRIISWFNKHLGRDSAKDKYSMSD